MVSQIPHSWLIRRTTITEIESECMEVDGSLDEQPSEFITAQDVLRKMRAFVSQIKNGDQLWKYRSSEDTWQSLCGEQGFAIIRNGQTVDVFITMVN